MPTGVTVTTGSKAWSAALVGTRLLPPRAKGPTLTVVLASIESHNTPISASAFVKKEMEEIKLFQQIRLLY
jgi:hypothetical protein